MTSYNEGRGIADTLSSLWIGMVELGLQKCRILLSDSSSDLTTVKMAEQWANKVGAALTVDHSDSRRSLKSALNTILNACESELLVVAVGDVTIPAKSLERLVRILASPERPDVVIGATAPDPTVQGLRYRAGAWQLRVVGRLASLRTSDEVRAEGAFWGTRREFYQQFRYTERSGSISDDVQLQQAVLEGNHRGINAPEAIVYKVPPASMRDFALQARRYYFAIGSEGVDRSWSDLRALLEETAHDPLGSVLYAVYRAYAKLYSGRLVEVACTELWEISASTKRGGPSDSGGFPGPLPTVGEATNVKCSSERFIALARLRRLWRLLTHVRSTASQITSVVPVVDNWLAFLFRILLSYFGLMRGDLTVRLNSGTVVNCRNNTESWLPIYEVFVQDVYHLNDRTEKAEAVLNVVDIGGHVGAFTLAIAERFQKASVYVYEPSPAAYACLKKNVLANQVGKRVRTVEAAVAMKSGRAIFHEAGDASCGSSLFPLAKSVVTPVDVMSFDDVIRNVAARVDILKIDCEGGEYDIVLQSDDSTWRDVGSVLVEYHPMGAYSFHTIEERLNQLGFGTLWREESSSPGIGMLAFGREDICFGVSGRPAECEHGA